jgi:hypothetical protein
MKIHSMGTKFVHTDGRTDRHDGANCACERAQKLVT